MSAGKNVTWHLSTFDARSIQKLLEAQGEDQARRSQMTKDLAKIRDASSASIYYLDLAAQVRAAIVESTEPLCRVPSKEG